MNTLLERLRLAASTGTMTTITHVHAQLLVDLLDAFTPNLINPERVCVDLDDASEAAMQLRCVL